MPLSKLNLRPGINTNATPTMNESGWSSSNLVRWKNGFLEKIGGWRRLFEQSTFNYARAMHAFEDLDTNLNLLIGGDGGLQVYQDTLYDISLADFQTDAGSTSTPTITPSAGSTLVTVIDANYSPATGSFIYLPMTLDMGGRVVYPAQYQVTRISSTTYTFNMLTPSPGSGIAQVPIFGIGPTYVGTNKVRVQLPNHSLSVGSPFDVQFSTVLNGAGVTLFGRYTVIAIINPSSFDIDSGQISTGNNGTGDFEGTGNTNGRPYIWYIAPQPQNAPNWYIDNLGNNSIISYTNSNLYQWAPPVVFGANVASVITTAPEVNSGCFVAMPQAQIISFGASALGVQDPLLLAWSDAGSYTVWAASSTNQAGTYRLSRGSRIIGGLQAPQTTLIWTDTDLWSMQYNGPPFVYGFTIIGTGCGLISPKARASIGGVTYWMGLDGFWQYAGAVQPLNCDVWDVVFNDMDRTQVNKCFAGASSSFQDMYFFYPSLSGGTGEIDSYVKVNFSTGTPLWDYGRLVRTAWIDNNVFGPPLGADGSFRVQQHETGYDNDDQPMTGSFAQSGMIDLGEGDQIMSVTQIQPDFKFFGENGSNMITLWTQNYAGEPPVMRGPYPATPTTRYVSPRARARQMAVRVDLCPTLNSSARLGAIRILANPAGTRP